LRAEGTQVLDAMTPALINLPNQIAIEGHTDDRPIHSPIYPTNWELSTARATSVLRYLLTRGMPNNRVSAAGYADQRPRNPKDKENDKAAAAGEIAKLDSITLNLADGHYVKLGLALQLKEGIKADVFGGQSARALDFAISTLGDLTYAQLAAPGGRNAAKDAL